MFNQELIIIRHARSTNNIRVTNDPDCSLTEYGRKQSQKIGKFMAKHLNLSSYSFYTSPFKRCLQTANEMANEMGKFKPEFEVMESLREYINHNMYHEASIKSHHEEFTEMNWISFPRHGVIYKDEFNEDFINRMHEAYRLLPEKSVVVTHGLPALLLLEIATKNTNSMPIWDHSLDNGSITLIKNGRTIWHGRNLYHEIEGDPFDKSRPYDACDLLVPKT